MLRFNTLMKIVTALVIFPFIFKLVKKDKTKFNIILCVILWGYLTQIIGIFFFPIIFDFKLPQFSPSIQLVPLVSLIEIFRLDFMLFIKQALGNILIFAPMGFLLPFIFNKLKNFKILILLSFALSFSIELIQLIMNLIFQNNMRSSDINDIILNVIGAVCGFILYKIAYKKLKNNKDDKTEIANI